MYFKTFGGRIYLKEGVVPHKNLEIVKVKEEVEEVECVIPINPAPITVTSLNLRQERSSSVKRKRMKTEIKAEHNDKNDVNREDQSEYTDNDHFMNVLEPIVKTEVYDDSIIYVGDCRCDLVRCEMRKIETNSYVMLGIPSESFFVMRLAAETGRLDYKSVLLTLKKIRLGLSNDVLAVDFQMTVSQVNACFVNTLRPLASMLRTLITWTREDMMMLKKNGQKQSKLQSIVDCLEIKANLPDNGKTCGKSGQYLARRIDTIKYLVSVTPCGFLNYISPGYVGIVNDKDIVVKSDYLKILPDNTSVMADSRFEQLAKEFVAKNCILLRPAGVKKRKGNVVEERIEDPLYAIVKRVVTRIEEFLILGPYFKTNDHLEHLDDIVIVAASIINLQANNLANDHRTNYENLYNKFKYACKGNCS